MSCENAADLFNKEHWYGYAKSYVPWSTTWTHWLRNFLADW